eukprot:11240410-Prorocentrum_lima.AAC.1
MTSSLVGSEMCIRDSSSSPPNLVRLQLVALAEALHRVRRMEERGPFMGCLLYTSDAADDM